MGAGRRTRHAGSDGGVPAVLARELGVHFRGAVYPVEVKKASLFAKSHEEAYRQVAKYIDRLGMSEGWLVVADPDLTKPWEEKIGTGEVVFDGKAIHVVKC